MTEPRDIFEALFVGDDVDDASVAQAAKAAREDDELRALFDGLAAADRELGGDFEARVSEAWFLDSLDDMLAGEEQANNAKVVELPRRNPTLMHVFAAAAVALLAFGGVQFYKMLDAAETVRSEQMTEHERREGFQPRSATEPTPTTYEMPKVAVFCVERTDDGVKFVGAEESELATVRCNSANEIKLAVANPDARLRYAAFVGISGDETVYWYGPSPAARDALAIPTTAEMAPVGESIRLGVNHEPGTVHVLGVFAEEPMTYESLQSWVRENEPQLWDGKVEVPNGVVVRQTFEVEP